MSIQNNFNKYLHDSIQYLLINPTEVSLQKTKSIVCNEVIDALKGQKTSRHTHSNHIFKFGYREVYAKNNLPDYIVFYNNQKDFFEGFVSGDYIPPIYGIIK